jgi:protein tyrosine phosphatase
MGVYSAGVGRTGTFIVLDWMLQHIRYARTVDIFDTVLKIRQFRRGMVQTAVKFIYAHLTLGSMSHKI